MRTRHTITLITAAFLAFAALSACDTTASLVSLRHATPPADPYVVALSGMYRDYAEAKLGRYDWWVSQHFADKGLALTEGKDVAPENLADWDIPADKRDELERARTSLTEALTPEAKKQHPTESASAMYHFDCWVEKTDGGWNIEEMKACRERFFLALAIAQSTSDPLPPGEEGTRDSGKVRAPQKAKSLHTSSPHPTPLPTGEGKRASAEPAALPTVSSSMVLYFPFDGARLEQRRKAALDGLVASLKAHPGTQLVINGHADRVGTDDYNMGLSANRAKYIKSLLVAEGIPADRVEYFAFGESDPAIRTGDNVAARANRRVEIYIE